MRDQDIERLFAEHFDRLYAFVVYRTGDASSAEEILGDTFERVVRTHRRFDSGRGSEQAWIYTIALNLVRDHQRRAVVENRALIRFKDHYDGAGAHDALDRLGDRDELLRALDTLKPDEREILALRYGADLRLKDIAKLTGRPLSTVHEHLHRALRTLQTKLSHQEAPPATPPAVRSRHG